MSTEQELKIQLQEEAAARATLTEEYRQKGFPFEHFDLVFHYREGLHPFVVDGVVTEKNPDGRPVRFNANWEEPETLPALPFLARGEARHMGWDIATSWAIDSKKRCWMDNAHGCALFVAEVAHLFSALDEEPEQLSRARTALGLKPLLPSWAAAALGAGWTPPADFDRSKYE